MAQFKFLLWLAYWFLKTDQFEFEWDNGNYNKSIIKHGISIEEVESVFTIKLGIPIGKQFAPEVNEDRFCLLGYSDQGRLLSIVFTLRDHRVRPISSRMASRKEKKIYEEICQTIKGV